MLSIAAFYGLMYWALLTVTGGVATVVLALVPLATVLLAAAQRLERFRFRSVLGGAVAVVGIAWLALQPGRVSLPTGPLLALLGAALCVSQSVILANRLADHHPTVTNTVATAVGALDAVGAARRGRAGDGACRRAPLQSASANPNTRAAKLGYTVGSWAEPATAQNATRRP